MTPEKSAHCVAHLAYIYPLCGTFSLYILRGLTRLLGFFFWLYFVCPKRPWNRAVVDAVLVIRSDISVTAVLKLKCDDRLEEDAEGVAVDAGGVRPLLLYLPYICEVSGYISVMFSVMFRCPTNRWTRGGWNLASV